jgi:hypothetical protein
LRRLRGPRRLDALLPAEVIVADQLTQASVLAERQGRAGITTDDVVAGAREISNLRLQDLVNEYEEVLPELTAYVAAFSGRPPIAHRGGTGAACEANLNDGGSRNCAHRSERDRGGRPSDERINDDVLPLACWSFLISRTSAFKTSGMSVIAESNSSVVHSWRFFLPLAILLASPSLTIWKAATKLMVAPNRRVLPVNLEIG